MSTPTPTPAPLPAQTAASPSDPAGEAGRGQGAWIVWSNEHRAFWRPNQCGYTGRIDWAGRYTKAEAETICNGANYRAISNLRSGTPPEIYMPAPEAVDAFEDLYEALVEAKRELWAGARHQWTSADFKNWAVIQQIDAALAKAKAR